MILQIAAAVVFLLWFVLLRPRKGGKDAPPTVTASRVVPIPVFGVLAEFFKSPNTMVKRCVEDYGSVFTIPVSQVGGGWMDGLAGEQPASRSERELPHRGAGGSYLFGRLKSIV